MNLQQLRTFEAVARHRSFTRAAEELTLTQPAVSVQIRTLEESLGVTLFERSGRQVTLTEPGTVLFEYARRILALVQEARSALDDLEGLKRGRISISTVTTPGAYVLPPLLAAFRALHPGILVHVEVTNRAVVRRRLLDNEVDLILMGRPPDDLEPFAKPFLANDLVVFAAPVHRLAGKRSIPLERLAEETFVLREPGSGTRLAVEDHFAAHGIRPQPGLEVGDTSGVKEAVAAGLGISVLSRHALEMELRLGRLVILDVRTFPLRRPWYIVRSPGRRPSRAAQAFESFLLSSAESLLPADAARSQDGRPRGRKVVRRGGDPATAVSRSRRSVRGGGRTRADRRA